jgi:hypothetical protein
MAPLLSFTILTFTFLLSFAHAGYDGNARTNVALYWVCLRMIPQLTQLTYTRAKGRINNVWRISVVNLVSI